MKWTYELARAAARDAANRHMLRGGRLKWNRDDYNVAAETFNRLFPQPKGAS